MRNTDKENEKALLEESEEWESGKRGKEVVPVSPEEEKELDVALHLQMVSLRLPLEWVKQFKRLATVKGMKYQPYIRQILGDYLRGGGVLEERVSRLENAILKVARR